MTGHRRTDPACRGFRPPRFWWQRWLFDRARGLACQVCVRCDRIFREDVR